MKKEPGTRVGVWIDRRQAVLVRLHHGRESVARMESSVDDDRRHADERTRTTRGRNDWVSENKTQGRWRQGLTRYIREVARVLRNTDQIYVLGPGRAKQELYKELLVCGLGERIVGVETTEKMSQRQLLAKVRSVFQVSPPVVRRPGGSAEREEPDGPRPEGLTARADIEAWIEGPEEPGQPGIR